MKKKNNVLLKVLAAIVLGTAVGLMTGAKAELFGIPCVRIYGLIGQLFLNALTLVVVPLVASSLITGSAKIGKEDQFGQLGSKTFIFFILTTLIGVLIGAAAAVAISPGKAIDSSILSTLADTGSLLELEKQASGGVFDKIEQILYRIIPPNIIAAAGQGQMLGIILFALLFGFFSSRIENDLSKAFENFWTATFKIMMLMTHLIMKALPFGVFGLMAKISATTGMETLKPIALFSVTVLAGLACFVFAALPLLLKFIGGISPIAHFKAIAPALITAFSTSSTAVTLPVTMECMEKRAGVPNRICSFILPLGASMNLSGTALYAVAAVLFIAQAYGVEISPAAYFTIILMGLLTGMGMVAGIPSASVITIIIMLQTIGVPAEGVILILSVERILDMLRTTSNVLCNSACASLVYHFTSFQTPAESNE